ncbi:MAG: hypothetical protein ACE15C_13310 [Phycisphaerae bacterium]
MSNGKPAKRFPLFRTRNYKHEITFRGDGPRNIVNYTDRLWEALVGQIAARGFTGIVFYPDDGHPFAHLLDYAEFPYAACRPETERTAVREAFNRLLAAAHRNGLTTFMQHYIGHFTREMADHARIGPTPSGLLSGVDHPEINRYCQWCYREIFRQCPDLDGLYFNFESSPNSYKHVLTCALPEFEALPKRPICVYRLWNASSVEGVKSLVKAYSGRTILGHKVADTSDTYHYPSADSRVLEWHRHIPGQEFMFLIGPCHNCGTNLCEQLWADYGYVQRLIGDAWAKGADSISFHSRWELLSSDVPDGERIFSERERMMSRYNILHLDAVVDFVHGRSMGRAERAERMAARVGVSPTAGKHLVNVLESTSSIVINTYEQFYHSLAWEGFLNPGRYSHTQDPFYFYPSNGINNTRPLNIWTAPLGTWAWITKTMPARVAPDDELQHIIDYVDPSKPRARRHPKLMAGLLRKGIDGAYAALEKYRAAAGGEKADELLPDLRANALVGEYTRREILGAIDLYSIYFARSKAAVVKALRKGLVHAKALEPLLEADKDAKKSMQRVLYWDWFGAADEPRRVEAVLDAVTSREFPFEAFRQYVQSHRQYNEIRRICRAYHQQNAKTLAYASRQLKKAVAAGKRSLALLKGDKHADLAANVTNWLDYLRAEIAHITPPSANVPRTPSEGFHPMFHDDCFRMGEHFLEDFLGFFGPIDYMRKGGLAFAIWNTGDELAITWRETGIDIGQRKAQWAKYRGSGSDSFVMRAAVSTDGREVRPLIVWPMGEKVACGMEFIDARTEFSCDATSWQTTAFIPYAALGARPKRGDKWRLNVTANPYVARNLQYTWSPQYDGGGNLGLFGTIDFE